MPPADTCQPCSVHTALRGWTVHSAEGGTAPASSTVCGDNPTLLPLRNLPPPPSFTVLNASPWARTGGQTDAGTAFRAGGGVTGETERRSRIGAGRCRKVGPEPPSCPGDGSQLSCFSTDSRHQPKTACSAGAEGAGGPGTVVRRVERGGVSAAAAGGHGQRGQCEAGLPATLRALGMQRFSSSVPPAGEK